MFNIENHPIYKVYVHVGAIRMLLHGYGRRFVDYLSVHMQITYTRFYTSSTPRHWPTQYPTQRACVS